MKLILVRHGKEDERYRGGWSNRNLTPDGLEQARQLAEHLKKNYQHYAVTQIISSDLQRTITTADCIGDALRLPVQKEARLREMNNGDLAGMLNTTASEQYPGLFFNTLEMDEAYPNGESPRDFFGRIKLWFEEFGADLEEKDGNVLIVTHGGVINIIYHLVRGMEWSNKGPGFRAVNCSIHVLDMDTMEIGAEEELMNYDCGFEKGNNWFRYRTGGILIHNNKMLFVKSAIGDYYYMIGGGVHMGETSETCIEREVLEEAGIHASVDYLAVVCENFFKGIGGKIDGRDCHTLEFYYCMKIKDEDLSVCKTTTDDGEELVWLPIEKIETSKIKPDFMKEKIHEILSERKTIHVIEERDR